MLAIGFPGDPEGGDQRPDVNCKVNLTSAKSCQNFAGKTANNLNEQIEMNLIAAYDYEAMVGAGLSTSRSRDQHTHSYR